MPKQHDASDEQSVAAAAVRAGRRQKRLDSALSELLASANGRLWFWDLLERCHVLNTPFIQGDSHATAFNCGGQNVGLQLMDQLSRVSPEAFGLMMKENKENEDAA